jgi:ribonuclease HI
MSVPAPHFLLYTEAVAASPIAGDAAQAAAADRDGRNSPTVGSWKFMLRLPSGELSLEAGDDEADASSERLELLAVVRGLEALEQPSRVTLVTSSRHIRHGLSSGLPYWRENGWHWERFGRLSPVKNSDLWQRIDRLTDIHHLNCRPGRLDKADDLAAPPTATSTLIRTRSGKRLRIDPPPAGRGKHQAADNAADSTDQTNSTDRSSNARNVASQRRFGHWLFSPWCLFGHWSLMLSALTRLRRNPAR